MNTIHQISRNNSGGSDTDSADGNVLYKNLDKNKNDSSKDNDHHHYSNDDTVEDFVNPLFKENTPPDYNDKPSPLSASNSYDQLNFSNSKKPDGAKEERTLTNSSSNLSSQQFQPFTQRTDITKPPEEIEMGVGNFAFEDDRSRQNSWENSLSVFTPYAVNTPVSNPVNPLDTRMNSLTTHEKRVSSNCSDYSLASDENPYAAPSEKSPQYEDLAAMHAKLQEEHESKNAVLPARNGNQKKRNMLYEPAVITSKHKEVRRTTSLGAEPKEAYDVDERASYCHVIFTILVGIIALIAIVVVFLLVFGIISAKKCEECSISNAPSTGASTGASTDKGSGDSSDSNTQLQLELQYLRGNVSKLQRALDAVTKDNTKAKITILENEVQSQKFKVKALSSELAYQNNVTKTLNETIRIKRSGIPGLSGHQGIAGHNGSVGAAGTIGVGPDFANCYVKMTSETGTAIDVDSYRTVLVQIPKLETPIGAFCSTKTALTKKLKVADSYYECTCSKVEQVNVKKQIDCTMHMFLCPTKPI